MSPDAWEQRALDSIGDGLAGSDPRLAALLGTFTRLASGEKMPVREELPERPLRAVRRSRRKRRPSRRGPGRRFGRRLGVERVGAAAVAPDNCRADHDRPDPQPQRQPERMHRAMAGDLRRGGARAQFTGPRGRVGNAARRLSAWRGELDLRPL